MNLKLACADFTFPLLPHNDVLKLVAMLGFEGVDIGLFEDRSHIYPSHVLSNMAVAARDLSARVEDKGLMLADIFYQGTSFEAIAVNHPDAAERRKSREMFQKVLEFTLRCNAPHLTVLPGVAWEDESYETSLKRMAEELTWRVELAQQVGVIFAIEAHLGSLIPTPAQTLELLEMTPGLSLTLDYTHFVVQGFSDDECEKLMPYASHFHVRAANKEQLQSKYQNNVVDYARVLRAMRDTGYAGYVGVEYVWIDWERLNEVDNVSETIQMRDHLLSVEL